MMNDAMRTWADDLLGRFQALDRQPSEFFPHSSTPPIMARALDPITTYSADTRATASMPHRPMSQPSSASSGTSVRPTVALPQHEQQVNDLLRALSALHQDLAETLQHLEGPHPGYVLSHELHAPSPSPTTTDGLLGDLLANLRLATQYTDNLIVMYAHLRTLVGR